jgi:glycerophosphoryl diester phosphodiesterase
VQEIIAHRGASAYEPEHTLAAYDLALRQGAEVLEVDVRATADGEIVVVHDDTLLRTAGDPRRVDEVAFGDLESWLRPLTLGEVVARYGDQARILVDLKRPSPAWEPKLLAILARRRLRRRVVVQSFDHVALRRLRAQAPWLALGALVAEVTPRPDLDALASFADAVGPWHGMVDAALVAAAHARGLAVRPWTVNDPLRIERLVGLGVDGVITDVPDVAVALRDAAAVPLAA